MANNENLTLGLKYKIYAQDASSHARVEN